MPSCSSLFLRSSALALLGFAAGPGALAATDETLRDIRARIEAVRPGLVLGVAPSPHIEGMFVVTLAGGQEAHVTADGRYLLPADVWEVREGSLANLTEEARASDRVDLLAAVDRGDMTVFSPDGEVKASVTVFTDVDCGFCRKFHQEVPALNEMGIEVRYLAYPRAGVQSASYNKLVSAWCADDRQTALTRLKAGQSIPPRTCSNPVSEQYLLGQRAGISGTPAVITASGEIVGGYVPAEQLATVLEVD